MHLRIYKLLNRSLCFLLEKKSFLIQNPKLLFDTFNLVCNGLGMKHHKHNFLRQDPNIAIYDLTSFPHGSLLASVPDSSFNRYNCGNNAVSVISLPASFSISASFSSGSTTIKKIPLLLMQNQVISPTCQILSGLNSLL